jgi:hypothetical protein
MVRPPRGLVLGRCPRLSQFAPSALRCCTWNLNSRVENGKWFCLPFLPTAPASCSLFDRHSSKFSEQRLESFNDLPVSDAIGCDNAVVILYFGVVVTQRLAK